MVIGRCCGRRRVDAERLREAQTHFLSSAAAPEASGKARPAAAGRVHVLRRNAEEGDAASVPGLVSPGGALERLAARRGTCSKHARQVSPVCFRGAEAGRGHAVPRTRGPGEHRRRAGVCPCGRTPFCLSRPAKYRPLPPAASVGSRPCKGGSTGVQTARAGLASDAAGAATRVAVRRSVFGVHVRP